MRKKLFPQLWMYFVAITFLMMVVVLAVFVGLLFIVNHYQLLAPEKEGHLFPFYFIIFLSLVIGATLSFFVGKRILLPIKGYVQLLQNEELSKEERQIYLERMLDGTHQLTHLTDNILKLSKLENQGIGLDFQYFRLDEQIREVILFLQPKWEQLNLSLDLDLPWTEYYGNEEFLYQVWLNLMDNAIKYSRKNSNIRVYLKNDNAGQTIMISDEGIGMTEDVADRIFDKFYQSDTSRKTKGNGLGLALAKQIIELHHGTIKVNSSPNKGSNFKIFLPSNLKNS